MSCQNLKGTFAVFAIECNKHRSHSKLTKCLNPALLVTMAIKEDTPTFEETMASPDQAGFLNAMEVEIQTSVELEVHDLTPNMKVISSAWAFKRKRFPDGSVQKLKARFCARGFEWEEGVDHFETFALVAMWMTARLLLIMSILMSLETKQVDCTAAFVHAPIDCTVCVQCSKPFEVPNKVWKLRKSLDGLAQSPCNFFLHTEDQLEQELGFAQSMADPCPPQTSPISFALGMHFSSTRTRQLSAISPLEWRSSTSKSEKKRRWPVSQASTLTGKGTEFIQRKKD